MLEWALARYGQCEVRLQAERRLLAAKGLGSRCPEARALAAHALRAHAFMLHNVKQPRLR